jgi:hypothetical protein
MPTSLRSLAERLSLGRQELLVERDRAAVDRFEPVDRAAQRGLAGPGRPDHHHDLATVDDRLMSRRTCSDPKYLLTLSSTISGGSATATTPSPRSCSYP